MSELLGCHSQLYKSQWFYVCSRYFYYLWCAVENLLLVGFVLVLPSFSPRLFQAFWESCCRVSFLRWSINFVVIVLYLLPYRLFWLEADSDGIYTLNATLCVICLNEVRERDELSAVKFPYCSFRVGIQEEAVISQKYKVLHLVWEWRIRQTIRKLAKNKFCKIDKFRFVFI